MPVRPTASCCVSASRWACTMPDVEVSGGGLGAGVELVAQSFPARRAFARAVWGGRGRYMAGVVGLAAAYYAAAKAGYELEFAGPVAAIVWFPAGVAIAVLCLGGLRFWPGVLLGDLLANDYSAVPVGSALGQTLGNMVEVVVAAVVIRRLLARGSPLDSLGGLGRLLAAIAADGDQRDRRSAVAVGRKRDLRQ